MIPGLWYEMEAVSAGSKHYNDAQHLVKKDGVPLTVGGRRFWDMEDPWVVDYLSEKVIGILKDAGFGYLKVDYNDTLGMGCDGAESMGEGLRRKIVASQKFFEKIREEIPGIVIENCSSGGHRLEPSMMQICSQASFSDAHEIKSIPLIAANVQRVIRPQQSQIWAVLRAKDSKERIEYSLIATLFGRMCLSGDIYDLSEEQWELVRQGMEFYRQAADVIRYGKTILHEYEETGYNHPQGQQLSVREWNGKGLAILHRFENSKKLMPDFPEGSRILAEYGSGDGDFSAKAWLYDKGEKEL
jgi:alpha-galactosidase